MVAIGFADEPCGRRQICFAPRAQLQVGRQIRLRLVPSPCKGCTRKSLRKISKSSLAKHRSEMPEGCRSNCDSMRSTCGELSSNSKRCRSSVSSVMRPGWTSTCAIRVRGQGEYVADDGLGFLIDAEHIAVTCAGLNEPHSRAACGCRDTASAAAPRRDSPSAGGRPTARPRPRARAAALGPRSAAGRESRWTPDVCICSDLVR